LPKNFDSNQPKVLKGGRRTAGERKKDKNEKSMNMSDQINDYSRDMEDDKMFNQ